MLVGLAASDILVVMLRAMSPKRNALKITDVVVARVPVDVMDLMPLRDRAVVELPDIPVETTSCAGKISAMGRVRRLRIAVVAIPVEDNSLHNGPIF